MITIPRCKEYILHYDAWKNTAGELTVLLEEYTTYGEKKTYNEFQKKKIIAEQSQKAFLDIALKRVPTERDKNYMTVFASELKITQIEADVLDAIGQEYTNAFMSVIIVDGYLKNMDMYVTEEVEKNTPVRFQATQFLQRLKILTFSGTGSAVQNNNVAFDVSLPPHLEELYCYYTCTHTLPRLPDSLKILNCNSTRITRLPRILPSSLERLSCEYTQVGLLPMILPDTLKTISIGNTPASQNEYIIDQLKSFQKTHPACSIHYR